MEFNLIINEILHFLIGAGCGITANIYLRRKEQEFNSLADSVNEGIKSVLRSMADRMEMADKSGYADTGFEELDRLVERVAWRA